MRLTPPYPYLPTTVAKMKYSGVIAAALAELVIAQTPVNPGPDGRYTISSPDGLRAQVG